MAAHENVSKQQFHWDLDWEGITPTSVPVSRLTPTQYPDASKPKGRFDINKMDPLKVVPEGDNYKILDGHHRKDWAASRGYAEVPALIHPGDKGA